jgi:hypothetical protein
MIDRKHELSVSRQARELGISRGSIYYLPRATSVANLALMRRIDELHLDYPFAGSRMLEWLPHISRAALTGLRKKGYTIERFDDVDGGTSRHRISQSAIAGIASDRIKTPRVLSPGSVKPRRPR